MMGCDQEIVTVSSVSAAGITTIQENLTNVTEVLSVAIQTDAAIVAQLIRGSGSIKDSLPVTLSAGQMWSAPGRLIREKLRLQITGTANVQIEVRCRAGMCACNRSHLNVISGGSASASASTVDVSDRVARLLGHVNVDNFPATQPVSLAAAIDIVDRAARLLGHVNVDNFPATQPVSIAAALDIVDRAARLLGHVNVDNFPATQPVSIAAALDIVDRAARLLGHVNVDNFPATQPISAAALPLPAGAATDASLTNGNQLVSTEGLKATYRFALSGLVAPAGIAVTLYGSASKTLRITKIRASATAATAALNAILINKFSSAPTVGTKTSPAMIPVDAADIAATATNNNAYTVVPTTGTLIGSIDAMRGLMASATVAGNLKYEWNSSNQGAKPIKLSGVTQGIGIIVSVTCTLDFMIEFTEV